MCIQIRGSSFLMCVCGWLLVAEHGCELGLVPYVKPNHVRRTMGENAKSLRHLPGSWVVTSKGELYKSGSKVVLANQKNKSGCLNETVDTGEGCLNETIDTGVACTCVRCRRRGSSRSSRGTAWAWYWTMTSTKSASPGMPCCWGTYPSQVRHTHTLRSSYAPSPSLLSTCHPPLPPL